MSEENNFRPSESLPPEMAERLRKRWQAAYQATSDEDLRSFYDDWADQYDADHEVIGCFHHDTAAALLAKHVSEKSATLVDIGAGTGLVGEALQRLDFSEVTAVDFSQEILDVARGKGVYQDYRVMNLNFPLDAFEDNQFDAAIGVGVFSYGQVEAVALDELVRIVRPAGIIVFTLRVDFHETNAMGFKEKQEQLSQAGAWRLVEVTAPAQYLPNKEPEAMFRCWAYEVLSD